MLSVSQNVPVSVEVSVAEVLRGIFEIEGLLRYSGSKLVFEYQAKRLGFLASEVKTLELPREEIQEILFKGWVGGRKIVVRVKRLAAIEDVTWANAGAITFKVKFGHREQAGALVAHLQRELKSARGYEVQSLPFQLPDIDLGFTEVKGLLYLEEEFLVFDVGTGISGDSVRPQQTVKIELRALDSIKLERGVLKDQLLVQPKKRDLLQVMPGDHKEVLTLKISKKYREEAEHLVYKVRQVLAE